MKRSTSLMIVLALAASAQADNWPQWRGPEFNGTTNEKNLPTNWSKTENIAWSADLPGPSGATPVVWDDSVFVSSADLKRNMLVAMCFDCDSGELRWQRDVAKGIDWPGARSVYSGPSPATDGKLVVFFYGNGDMVTYDFSGNKKWSKNVGPFSFQWTFSTSPVLFDGKLYLQVLQRNTPVQGRGVPGAKSYLLALAPESGEELWRVERPSDALAESLEAFTTPMPYVHGNRKEIIIAGGDVLTGHDPETGKELWRWGTWNPDRIGHWRLVPSPVAGEGIVLVCAPKRDPVYAIKAGGEGVLDASAVAWVSRETREVTSDVPTPAFYDGDFFVLSDVQKHLSRVEPKTGNVRWLVTTPGRSKYEASPLAADGKVYIVNFDGDVSVIDAADGKVLKTIPMGGDLGRYFVRSSVIAAHGRLFVRTVDKLYCVGK